MAFNFCHPLFKPKISCEKPSEDNYDLENLLIPPPGQSNGFRPSFFIKPPYSVVIQFPIPIEVKSVIICGKVGSQSVKAMEIFTSIYPCGPAFKDPDIFNHDTQLPQRPLARFEKLVGRANQKDSHIFKFENATFYTVLGFGSLRKMLSREHCCPTVHSLYQGNRDFLKCVTQMSVRIVQAGDSGAGAIQWMEIWGQPSQHLAQPMIRQLCTLHAQSFPVSKSKKEKQDPEGSQSVHKEQKVNITRISDHDIPLDFIDPITNDLMEFPVLLPCGQSIDSSTHEKYIEEEAKWGRVPNDPFTGKSYSQTSKFVPNTALKARIDQFLLKHGDRLKRHRLVNNHDANNYSTSLRIARPVSSLVAATSCEYHPNKRRRSPVPPKDQIPAKKSSTSTSVIDLTQSHSDKLESSLNNSLMNSLTGLPSFINLKKQEQSNLENSCTECRKVTEISDMYQIGCGHGHTICRDCALRFKKDKFCTCSICSNQVESINIAKCHS